MTDEIHPITMSNKRNCFWCHYEQVEHKKLHEEPCKTCFKEDTPADRYPKFKEVPED